MNLSKLRRIHIVIIGSVACALVVAGLYFLVIKKAQERIGKLEARLETAEGIWAQKAATESKLEAAKVRYRMVNAKYEEYLGKKMPAISFEDRAQGMIALWKEQTEVLGPMLEKWPGKTGVRLASEVRVPAAGTNPNAVETSLIRVPVGTFRVLGDFSVIMGHIRSWNDFGRLVEISPASLTGPSPTMTAEYTVTVLIFPRGETGPAISMASAPGGGISRR